MKNNWEEKNFNDCIGKIQYTTKILKKDFLEHGKYPIISQEEDYINGYWNNKEDLFKITKPVVIFGDHTKKIKYIDFDFVLGADGVKILQPIDKIDTKFFYYALLNTKIRDLGYARHFKLLQEKSILLPPLQQQKEIVKKLDKAFENIDKLTDIAKRNLENSKELFNSYLNKLFTENNNNWEEKKFNDCIEKIQYTAKILKKDFLEHGKYPIISQEEEYINGYWNNKKDLFKITKPVVIFGDHTKKIKYVDFDFVLGADGVKILQPIDKIDTKFFYYALLNTKIRDLGYARHYKLLQEKFISFPASLKEQKQIVKILDNLQEKTKKLEQIYNKKVELAKELKQSVLHKELQPSKV